MKKAMVEPMDEEVRKILKKDNREHLYALWGRAKEGNYDGLTDEEERIARIMLDHQDEYKKPFDLETYRQLLKKYKTRDPQKLMDLLEKDPLLSD